jgi:hypothetical protein
MNNFERFQRLQVLLVQAGFETTLNARREHDEAVISLSAGIDDDSPEQMARLAEITTENDFAFTVDGTTAEVTTLV